MPGGHTNHGYSRDEMEDRGRWTPVYFPSDTEDHPRKYMLPSDLLPLGKSRHTPSETPSIDYRRELSNGSNEGNHGKKPRQRNVHIQFSDNESPSPPPSSNREKDYSLLSFFRSSRYKQARDPNRKSNAVKWSTIFNYLLLILFVILYIIYFAAVILIHTEKEEEDYWCDGDGFLIIITGIAAVIIVYSYILKPFVKLLFKNIECKNNASDRSTKFGKTIVFLGLAAALIGFLIYDTTGERERLFSLFGIAVFIIGGILMSSAPRKIKWLNVASAFGFQVIFGYIVLRLETGRAVFRCFGDKVYAFLLFTDSGSKFIFGDDLVEQGIFAFKVLSIVVFFSLCVQVLYYYGVMQAIIIRVGWFLQKTVGTTACESISAAANIFLGQTEAPLMVKPYLELMTMSELHAVMTGGFASIAGTVMGAFISFGVSASHLLTAAVMNAPAALAMSKIYYPETEESRTSADQIDTGKRKEANVLHAALEGVSTAIPLVANIGANLLAFVAVMAFIDGVLNWGCLLVNVEDGVCSLSNIFGYVFMPLAFVMGVAWEECYLVGQLIGTKVFVNEFVAYLKLAEFLDNSALSARAEIISTYAICGFGNISSIGIQIGGLGSLAPGRKQDLSKLAISALIAGCSTSFLTACIAGILTPSTESVAANSTLAAGNETFLEDLM